jgi:single-strand DNA-binding protein
MAGETVITIVGNLTADPELRTTRNGGTVANFSIAATPRVYDRQSNQWVDGDALFLRCTAWRDMAEHCANSLAKGMRVIAQGRLQQRSYQAQDGSNRTVIELQVDEIGPSLRYATAQVQKMQSGGYQGGNANGGGYQQPQQARQQPQAPADDPWGAPAGEPDF